MIFHLDLITDLPFTGKRQLYILVSSGRIQLAGNKKLRIYGQLNCKSGKRMRTGNRVFFSTETEALTYGYRPCARCMPLQYLNWKNKTNQELLT